MTMKSIAIPLFALSLAAAGLGLPAVAQEKSPTGADAGSILERLKKMDFERQQDWLRRLEARADRAAKIALTPRTVRTQAGTSPRTVASKTDHLADATGSD